MSQPPAGLHPAQAAGVGFWCTGAGLLKVCGLLAVSLAHLLLDLFFGYFGTL